MSTNQILVVDDEVGIRELLFEILRDEGYGVRLAENAQTARSARKEMRPDLVLLDIWMPDTDGITLLKEWAGSGQLTMPVVMMSGHGTIDSAVEATRIGAFDFLEKPISLPKLLATVGKALAGGRVLPKTGLALVNLGRARVVQELRQRLEQVGRLHTPVLLTGEPGCGFEVCARHLHLPNTPWVAPEDTEWLATNPFEPLNEAREGMLFLQEVSELSKAEQKGLAQLVGKLDKFNVRLVCAATAPLPALVDDGRRAVHSKPCADRRPRHGAVHRPRGPAGRDDPRSGDLWRARRIRPGVVEEQRAVGTPQRGQLRARTAHGGMARHRDAVLQRQREPARGAPGRAREELPPRGEDRRARALDEVEAQDLGLGAHQQRRAVGRECLAREQVVRVAVQHPPAGRRVVDREVAPGERDPRAVARPRRLFARPDRLRQAGDLTAVRRPQDQPRGGVLERATARADRDGRPDRLLRDRAVGQRYPRQGVAAPHDQARAVVAPALEARGVVGDDRARAGRGVEYPDLGRRGGGEQQQR
jgi:FixJ family two-component response regulator